MLTPNSSSRDTTAIHKIQNVFPRNNFIKIIYFYIKKEHQQQPLPNIFLKNSVCY